MTSFAKLACAFGLVTISVLWSAADGQLPNAGEATPTPAEQKIRNALNGNPNGSTGDGILDDVIALIQKRGSILDGSSLDNGSMGDNGDMGDDEIVRCEFSASDSDLGSDADPIIDRRLNQRALVAEQLLRAARMLIQTGAIDKQRANLITEMRAQAVRLLSESPPK